MIEEFHSIDELYDRVLPALETRMRELHKLGYKNVTSDNIWKYLIQSRWMSAYELTLYDVVSDILNVDGERLTNYILNKS